MNEIRKAQLKPSAILNVPFEIYDNDFLFIVNDEKFETSRFISDILSPKISQTHKTDPTFDTFVINTKEKGNFSHILNLATFNQVNIPEIEIPFFIEVTKILGNESINIIENNSASQITKNNVFSLIKYHINHPFYSKQFSEEIDFISSHLYELFENQKEELKKLSLNTLIEIFSNDHIQLNSEDQLLNIINELYSQNSIYSILYEFVYFSNVSSSTMSDFLSIFNFNDMTSMTWKNLSNRLSQNTNKVCQKEVDGRYTENSRILTFAHDKDKELNGIVHYLTEKTAGNISDNGTISIAGNSGGSSGSYSLRNIVDFHSNNWFTSKNEPNMNVTFDFKDKKIQLTSYSLKSVGSSNSLKNWILSVSDDGIEWEKVDERVNDENFRKPKFVATFETKKTDKFYRFIQIKQTDKNWCNNYSTNIAAIEFYGKLKQ